MSKLIRGAVLATFLCVLPRCGGTDGNEEAGGPSGAGQSTGGTKGGDAGSQSGGSGGAGDVAHAGTASGGEAGTSHVGGAAGASAAGSAGMAGAAGAVGLVGCGGKTCGANEYCRAACSGTNIGIGGTSGLPMPPAMPSCAPLPASCNGTPTCDCVCGPALGFATWCSTGSKPIAPGPAIQCGCA